jgi:hypothetical protein
MGQVSPPLVRGTSRSRLERRTGACLALDAHAFSYEGHAGSGVGDAVHPDKAIETGSHAAVDSPRRAPGGEPGHEASLGYENRGHGLAGKGGHLAAVKAEAHRLATRDAVALAEREASTAGQGLHARILASLLPPLASLVQRLPQLRPLGVTGVLAP